MLGNPRSPAPPPRNGDEPPARPDACPFCRSTAVGTHAKVVTVDTYWRCHACGEVWNVARLLAATRLPRSRSW